MRFPQATRREGKAGEASFTLRADAGLLAFRGHFPGNPILPGVVQVDWAIHFAVEAFGPLGGFRSIEQLKFMDIIHPDETIDLQLAFDPAKGDLRFGFHGPSGRKSAGIIRFAQGGN